MEELWTRGKEVGRQVFHTLASKQTWQRWSARSANAVDALTGSQNWRSTAAVLLFCSSLGLCICANLVIWLYVPFGWMVEVAVRISPPL